MDHLSQYFASEMRKKKVERHDNVTVNV